jgi:hypothetical protein
MNNEERKKAAITRRKAFIKLWIQKHIKPGQEFTHGDIYYGIFPGKFNRSKFGFIFNALHYFTKGKNPFLKSRLGVRGFPKLESEDKRRGVIYKLNPLYLDVTPEVKEVVQNQMQEIGKTEIFELDPEHEIFEEEAQKLQDEDAGDYERMQMDKEGL